VNTNIENKVIYFTAENAFLLLVKVFEVM